MAIGVLARQRVVAARQRQKKIVVQKPARQLQMYCIAGQLRGQELIFRHGVAFVPGMLAEVLARPGMFIARHGVRRQIRNGRLRRSMQHRNGAAVPGVALCVDEPAGQFVVDIGWEAIVLVKAAVRVDRGRIGAHQPQYFGTGGFVAAGCVVACQRANPLAECRPGCKPIRVVPAAEIVTRRG